MKTGLDTTQYEEDTRKMETPTKKLYLCMGCFQIHYDNDYSKEQGDIIIRGKFKKKYLENRSKL